VDYDILLFLHFPSASAMVYQRKVMFSHFSSLMNIVESAMVGE